MTSDMLGVPRRNCRPEQVMGPTLEDFRIQYVSSVYLNYFNERVKFFVLGFLSYVTLQNLNPEENSILWLQNG